LRVVVREAHGIGPRVMGLPRRIGVPVPFPTAADFVSLWVAETSSRNEVVDSVGFVPKLISHVRDRLGAPALPVVLAPSQTRTGVGEFSPPAPDRRAPSEGA